MLVRIRLFANRIPQSRSVMNLAFGLDNFSVRCKINFWKALPLVDRILSFIWTSLCTILLGCIGTRRLFFTPMSVHANIGIHLIHIKNGSSRENHADSWRPQRLRLGSTRPKPNCKNTADCPKTGGACLNPPEFCIPTDKLFELVSVVFCSFLVGATILYVTATTVVDYLATPSTSKTPRQDILSSATGTVFWT